MEQYSNIFYNTKFYVICIGQCVFQMRHGALDSLTLDCCRWTLVVGLVVGGLSAVRLIAVGPAAVGITAWDQLTKTCCQGHITRDSLPETH